MGPHFTGALSTELANRLHDVARCPFATSAELQALTGRAFLSNVHRNIASLRERGLIQSVHFRSSSTGRASARHFLTREGLRVLSEWLEQPESVTLRELPVSAEWQQELFGRVEILALVYRVAVQVARSHTEAGDDRRVSVLFPRDDALDGIIDCANGLWFSVIRQGYGLSLSNLRKRFRRQAMKSRQPATVFVVTVDGLTKPPIVRRVLEWRSRFTGVISFDSDISVEEIDEAIWTLQGHLGGEALSLREVVENAVGLPGSRPFIKTSYKMAGHPMPLADLPESGWAELTWAQRQTLDDIFLWPLMDIRQLAALRSVPYANKALVLSQMANLGLIVRMRMQGLPRRRFALSDEGLRYVSSRDRTSLSALRKRWTPASDGVPAGTMFGKMQLESSHTEGVNDFAARLQTECGDDSYIMPSHRGMRHFSDSAGDSQVSPDLIAALAQDGSRYTVFVEYEMRAVSPNPMRDKLLPWLRYFGTPYPQEDFDGELKLLFVLAGEKEERVFHQVADELCRHTAVSAPLATTHKDLLEDSATTLSDSIWWQAHRQLDDRSAALPVRMAEPRSERPLPRFRAQRRSTALGQSSIQDDQVPSEIHGGTQLSLGEYLRMVRNQHRLSLRDVQRVARRNELGASLSSGYLSVLERDGIKEPSPKVLYALAAVYEVDYIDLMKRAGYIPPGPRLTGSREGISTFMGASRLDPEQRRRIQCLIDLELNDSGGKGRLEQPEHEDEAPGQ